MWEVWFVTRGFPYVHHPTGWYQVAWSAELGPGDVRPLRYFGRDLVAWRGSSGRVNVFDAFCPHLGAHMGYGGTVCGDDLECPFHGWQWSAEGRNVAIPYSKRRNPGQRVTVWPVREANGLILVWYDADGAQPTWEPPLLPEAMDEDRYDPYPLCTKLWESRRLKPQFIGENAVDPAHQKYVHGATEVPEIIDFSAEGPRFHARQRMVYGQGKDATWLTPEGEVVAYLDAEVWGMGLAIARFEGTDDSVHLQCQTPVDDEHTDLRVTVLVRKEPGHPDEPSGAAMKRLKFQWRQVDNDLVMWEHMRYVTRPPLPPEEAKPYLAFRQWAKLLYPDGNMAPEETSPQDAASVSAKG